MTARYTFQCDFCRKEMDRGYGLDFYENGTLKPEEILSETERHICFECVQNLYDRYKQRLDDLAKRIP